MIQFPTYSGGSRPVPTHPLPGIGDPFFFMANPITELPVLVLDISSSPKSRHRSGLFTTLSDFCITTKHSFAIAARD